MIFVLHPMSFAFSSCSSTCPSHVVYVMLRMKPFDQPLTNKLETYRATPFSLVTSVTTPDTFNEVVHYSPFGDLPSRHFAAYRTPPSTNSFNF